MHGAPCYLSSDDDELPTRLHCLLDCRSFYHRTVRVSVRPSVGRSVGSITRPTSIPCIPSLAHGTLLTVTQKTRAGGWATMLLFRPNIVPICISLIFFTIKNYEQLIQDMQLIGLLMVDSYVAIYMPPLYHYTNKIN